MWGLWVWHFNNGEFATALDLAQKASPRRVWTRSSCSPEIASLVWRFIILANSPARDGKSSVLRRPADPLHQPHDVRSAFDHRVTSRSFLARILWLQGFPDQAMRMAKENVEDALALNHELSLANALVQAACPIAFFTGDLDAADHFTRMLVDHATKHALGPWLAWGRCFEGMLLIKRGDTVTGLQRLSAAINGLRDIGYAVYYVAFMGELAEALGRAGQTDQGLATIDEALARAERSQERWCLAELLRIKGELVVSRGARRGEGASGGRIVPPVARLVAPAGGSLLGVARGHQPRPPAARSRAFRRCQSPPPADLRSLHGGFRYRRSHRGEAASG